MNIPNPTYHRILDAAQDLIQVRGFNAFSYNDLSRTVGIKTASIHYYFPRKDELGEALTRRYREQFNLVLTEISEQYPDAPSRIERYMEQFLATLGEDGKICLCGMLAADYETLPENVRTEIRTFFTENEAWLAAVLEQGRAEGVFVFETKARDTARAFLSTLQGAMLTARIFDDKDRLRVAAASWRKAVLGTANKVGKENSSAT
ncbi:MAG: TetR/AcrR family transcriptional regulator [Pyrinomonadaceae bacterium]